MISCRYYTVLDVAPTRFVRVWLYFTRIHTLSCGEVDLRNKPADILQLSPKGTVPVLLLPTGQVIDESLDILDYLLHYKNDDVTDMLIDELHETFIPALNPLQIS